MKESIKTTKGEIYFFVKNGYIENYVKEYTEDDKEFVNLFPTKFTICDLMAGEEFADCVEDGGFIDSDGYISNIFVDDCKSNLGIWDYGIHQGQFCVGLYDFRKLCKEHKVEVNWANK